MGPAQSHARGATRGTSAAALSSHPGAHNVGSILTEGRRQTMLLPIQKRQHVISDAALAPVIVSKRKCDLEELCGPCLLVQLCTFLKLQEMPNLWRCSSGIRPNCDQAQLWRALFTRRCWNVLDDDDDDFSLDTLSRRAGGDATWRELYQVALQLQARRVPPTVRHLRRRFTGVLGPLSQFVSVLDEKHRVAARCGLMRQPILVNQLADGFECMKYLRAARCHYESIETDLRDIVFVSLEPEPEWQRHELDSKLAQLRGVSGTCKPLLDCICYQVDSYLDASQLVTALRKELGSTAICDGPEEAAKIARYLRCDVICCRGTRLAEFRQYEFPELRWKEWPSGRDLWDP